jgi:hypothetical protein
MELQTIISNHSDFLYFFKKDYPNSLFHNSNVFHRDLQYVLTDYVMKKEKKMLTVAKSEALAKLVETEFEKKGILKKLSERSWVLNYPDFVTPKVEKK